jgi:hypothetical protein
MMNENSSKITFGGRYSKKSLKQEFQANEI